MASSWFRVSKSRGKNKIDHGDVILAFDVGQIHLADCMLKVNMDKRPPFDVIKLGMTNLGSKSVRESIDALCTLLKNGDKDEWKEANFILIEQQARINTKMMAMSMGLSAALTMFVGPTPIFLSSVHKFNTLKQLSGMAEDIILMENKTNSKSVNKSIRKNNSIRVTRAVFNAIGDDVESHNTLFELVKANERDDLADAFVYACSFVYKGEPYRGF
jgi:hypothetical protein